MHSKITLEIPAYQQAGLNSENRGSEIEKPLFTRKRDFIGNISGLWLDGVIIIVALREMVHEAKSL
jgi:hypothetical protein